MTWIIPVPPKSPLVLMMVFVLTPATSFNKIRVLGFGCRGSVRDPGIRVRDSGPTEEPLGADGVCADACPKPSRLVQIAHDSPCQRFGHETLQYK